MIEGNNSMLKPHSRTPSFTHSPLSAHPMVQTNNYLPPLQAHRDGGCARSSPPSNNQTFLPSTSIVNQHHVADSLDKLRKSTISPRPSKAMEHQSNNQSNNRSSTTSEDKDSDDEYALHMQFRLKQRAKEQIRNELIRKRRYQSINQTNNQDVDSDDEVSLSEFIVPPSPKLRTRTLRKQSIPSFEASEEPFAPGFKQDERRSNNQSNNQTINQSNAQSHRQSSQSAVDLSMLSAQRHHFGGSPKNSSVFDARADDASPIIHVAKRLSITSNKPLSMPSRSSPPPSDVSSPFSQMSLGDSPSISCSSPNFESPNIASITRSDSPSYGHSPYLSNFSSPSAQTPSPSNPFRYSSLSRKSPVAEDSDSLPMLNNQTINQSINLSKNMHMNQRPSSRSQTSFVNQM